MVKAVLFDIYNTLIREAKDVGQYYTEAIRAVYGLNIEGINLADYEGMTTQETITEILTKNGLSGQEVSSKMAQFIEELPYSHYNVAGHDKAILMDGAQDVLKFLSGSNDCVTGIATGMLERIARNMFERAGLDMDAFFKFGYYGNTGKDFSAILEHAINQATVLGAQKDAIFVISSSPGAISAAHSRSIKGIGLTTGKYSSKDFETAGAYSIARTLKEAQKALR